MLSKIKKNLKFLKNKITSDDSSGYCTREHIDYFKVIDSPAPSKKELNETLIKGCNALWDAGINYWIARGSILGMHRDNTFLPNERDIDIDVLGDKDVYKIIRVLPFEVLRTTTFRNSYMDIAFYDVNTGVIFDILFYQDHGERLFNKNDYGYFWYPKDKFSKLGVCTIEENTYPAPVDLDWYCSFWFGDLWKTPQKYSEEWWIDYQKHCRAFVYNPKQKNSGKIYY